jgi:trans-aconitate methyltransferase
VDLREREQHEQRHPWEVARARFFRRIVADSCETPPSTIIDVGSGDGWFAAQLATDVPRATLTCWDVNYTAEDLAQPLPPGITRTTTPPDRPAQLVLALDVLEHIEDDTAALTTINGRMAPGGQLLLTVPAFQWAFTSWDTALGHHRRYSKRQLKAVAIAAGFELTSSAYLFPELLPLVAVRKLQRNEREHADFPSLPRIVDRSAELFSRATTAVRRIWPAGTSVVALLTKPAHA